MKHNARSFKPAFKVLYSSAKIILCKKPLYRGIPIKRLLNLMFIRGYHNPYSVVVIFKFRRICS